MITFGPDYEALKALINQHFGIKVYGFDYAYRDTHMLSGSGIKINLQVVSPDRLLPGRREVGSVFVEDIGAERGWSITDNVLFTYTLRLLHGPLTNQFLKVMNHANHPKRHPRSKRQIVRDYRRFKVEAAGAYRGQAPKPSANGRRFNVFGRPVRCV